MVPAVPFTLQVAGGHSAVHQQGGPGNEPGLIAGGKHRPAATSLAWLTRPMGGTGQPPTSSPRSYWPGAAMAPGDPEWDDLLLCGNTKPTQLRAPGKVNTRTTRTKRYCPAPDGTPAKMTVLAHEIPHAGQTGWQHLRDPRSPAMTDLLLTGSSRWRGSNGGSF
jgi:hypothetical protein